MNEYHNVQIIEGARVLYLKGLCKKDEKVAWINCIPTIVKKSWLDKLRDRFIK